MTPQHSITSTPERMHWYREAFPETNPLDRFRIAIADEISRIAGVDRNAAFDAVQRTATLEHGDMILAIPRLRLKGISNQQFGEKFIAELQPKDGAKLEKPTINGSSLQFRFAAEELPATVLPTVLQQQDEFGHNRALGLRDQLNPEGGRKKVIVEFSSPNIAKKFHAGHLRSTIIGGFLSNLLEAVGYEVARVNYLGDWGRQYGLLACGWKRYGDESAFSKDPIGHLFDIYVKISADFDPEEKAYKEASKRGEDTALLESKGLLGEAKAYFKRMEDGDEEALDLWQRFRALSIDKYKETYARLNIDFTEYSGESQVRKETMEMAEKVLQENGLVEPDGGAWTLDFEKHGAKGLRLAIVRNRNGTSNYLLRDIGAAVQREKAYSPDEVIYVVMSEQELHLKRLFKTLELMSGPYETMSKKMKHITFGKVMGMSTRKGTVKFLDDILTDVGDFMHEVMQRNESKYSQIEDPAKTAEVLGISAIMVQDMMGKRVHNYEFSLERMTAFEGDTGPYLQYAHARLCSIFRKVDITRAEMLAADYGLLSASPHAISLLRTMARYPDMVVQTLKNLEPTTILTYLFKLTHELSSSYDHLRVVNPAEGRAVSVARAALYEAARQILRNGMALLGLTPVERM